MGIGFGLFSSPNSNAIMSSVEKRHLGVASGVVGTMRMVGQMMSMGIAMMLIALYIGKQAINPATYPGFISAMRTGFIIFSVLCILGFLLLLQEIESLKYRKADFMNNIINKIIMKTKSIILNPFFFLIMYLLI